MNNYIEKNKKYIYFATCGFGEDNIFDLEFRTLFNDMPKDKILFSDIKFEPSRSIFTRERLEILCTGNTLENLLDNIEKLNLTTSNYRINYIKHNVEKTANLEQIQELRKESFAINGNINLRKPENIFGLTEIRGTWYFGILKRGKDYCESHVNKPNSYSVSCGVRIARVMANLAVKHDLDLKVIDPCCGAGTVVLELLSIGAKVSASDINSKVVKMANENLKYFGYDFNVKTKDIKEIEDKYDVVVLDIPYGLFTKIDEKIQLEILTESVRIGNRLVLLINSDIKEALYMVGYKIIDEGFIDKGNLRRHLLICEK